TLKTIREKGFKTALISDCSGEVPLIWDATPFGPLFDATVFSCVAGIKKPDPRIYRMATDPLGVRPEDCLYIGDGSSTELTGARAVGMHAVQIQDPDEKINAEYVQREENWDGDRISCLSEVLPMLGETDI
ncbi:MAG: HAD-IA family hydrolase, partial [Dehalococcoidales bacterium]|nr:HAD-IA family hydrolase [Dehalococcoidales bacterium]